MNRFVRAAIVAGLAILALENPSPCRGATYNWNVSSGTWSVASNWSPSTVPTAADFAYIDNSGTATISSGVTATCGTLAMGGPIFNAAVQLLSGGGLTVGGYEYVGNYQSTGISTTSTFTQSGGTHAVSGSMILGEYALSTGIYNLNGGLLSFSGSGLFQGSGSAAFNFSGGTFQAGSSFSTSVPIVLSTPGISGVFNTSGNTLTLAGPLSGAGGLTKIGAGVLTLSASNTYSGDTTVNGGTLQLPSGQLQSTNFYAGNGGTGAVAQSGGVNAILSTLALGKNGGDFGSYSLSGSGYVTAFNGAELFELIGNSGSGVFTQTGGTNNGGASGQISLGTNPGSYGAYSLSGSGVLTITGQIVGNSGSGVFTQTGGTNNAGGGFVELGASPGSSGSYSLSGSGYLAAFQELAGSPGSGTFVQSSGTNSIINTLHVGSGSGASGTYSLSGSGVLSTSFEKIGDGGSGSFTQSGGSNFIATELDLGYSAGGSGSYSLSGGSLTTTGNLFVGNSGSGTFTQTGGVNSVTGVMYLAYGGVGGSYNLSGSGALAAGTISLGAQATFTQSGGTVGPGIMLNSGTFSYSGGIFNARLVNGGTALFGSSFYAGLGIENDTTITVPAGVAMGVNGGNAANTVDNEGTLTLTGGTVAGGQTATTGGPIVNNGTITGYGALTSGVGITNNGQINLSGGNLTISTGTSTMTNAAAGTITLASGFQLRLSGGTLANAGSINLYSAVISGSGLLNNTSGNVSGPGTISAPFQNPGGVISVPLGATAITQGFTSSGAIQLSGIGANLSGGQITNLGTILGGGAVGNSCSNAGTIDALGALTFSGSLQNTPGGLISAGGGSEVLIAPGLAANYGVINLSGGIFDNNSHPLNNYGQISGYGTWQTSGLTNSGVIAFGGATSTVNGPVTNASGGTINISYNPVNFTGNVVNNGYFKITSTTVTYAGSFSNSGTYISDPAVNDFSSLAVGAGGLLQGGNGDRFFVTGSFTNAGHIDLGGTSMMVVGNGAGVLTQTSGSLDIGTNASLTAGTVEINGGALLADGPAGSITAALIYDSSSSSTYQGILAGGPGAPGLTVNNPAAVLVLSGSDTYTGGTYVESGTLIADSLAALPKGSSLIVGANASSIFAPASAVQAEVVAVPEPGTLVMLLTAFWSAVACYRFSKRRRKQNWYSRFEI